MTTGRFTNGLKFTSALNAMRLNHMTTEDLDKDIDTDIYLLEMMLDRLRQKIEARFQEIPGCMEDLLDELIKWIDERRGNEDD